MRTLTPAAATALTGEVADRERAAPTIADLTAADAHRSMRHFLTQNKSTPFITSCPYEPCNEEANAKRQATLAGQLEQRGLVFIDAIGQHRFGDWPGEASFLVLGLPLDAAKTLGTLHAQDAVVWSGPDAVPRLILLLR